MVDGISDTAESGDSASGRHYVIDMRRFDARERLPLLEMTLPVLSGGESVELTFETWPERLERYLGQHYAASYDWWDGGSGTEWHSLVVRRRAD